MRDEAREDTEREVRDWIALQPTSYIRALPPHYRMVLSLKYSFVDLNKGPDRRRGDILTDEELARRLGLNGRHAAHLQVERAMHCLLWQTMRKLRLSGRQIFPNAVGEKFLKADLREPV